MDAVSLGDKQLLYGDCDTSHYNSRQEYVSPAAYDALPPEERGGISVRNLILWKRGDVIGLEKFEHRAGYVRSSKHRIKNESQHGAEYRRMRLWVTSYKAMNDVYFNLKTGFFYLRRKRFQIKSPGSSRRSLIDRGIMRNPIRYLNSFDHTFGSYMHREHEPARSLAIALGVEDNNEVKERYVISDVIWRWFTEYHGIKYSDNWKMHTQFYPLMANMRKADMNMTRAILQKEGIYSKLTNKLLNEKFKPSRAHWYSGAEGQGAWECIDPASLIFWVKLLGDLFPKLGLQHLRRGPGNALDGSMTNVPWYVAERGVHLTRQEKLRLVRCSVEANEHELMDHISMHTRLRESGIPVVWGANNAQQFQVEHEAWSELNGRVRRAVRELIFDEEMVELVEGQTFGDWQPVILKSSQDYEEEGKYQRHCVGGYIDSAHNSFIVSLRHPDGRRITNEVTYDGNVLQSRGKCNTIPWDDPETKPIMKDFVNEMMRIYHEDGALSIPKVEVVKNQEVDNYLKGLEHLVPAERRC